MLKNFKSYQEERSKSGASLKREYLDGSGKVVENPKVKIVADYDGPNPSAPPAGNGNGKPAPYAPANAPAKAQKGETGFADMGDKNLIYNPKKVNPDTSECTPIDNAWPKAKLENFLSSARKMNASEFKKNILDENICGCNLPKVGIPGGGSFHPYPTEALRYTAALVSVNDNFMENFIFALKNDNALPALLAAVLEHKETYPTLIALFEDKVNGEKRSKNFARALEEAVAPPMGMNFDDEDKEEPELDDEGNPIEKSDEEPELDDEGNPIEKPEGEEEPELDDEGNPIEKPEDEEGGEMGPPPMLKHKIHPKHKFNLGSAMGSFESVKAAFKTYLG